MEELDFLCSSDLDKESGKLKLSEVFAAVGKDSNKVSFLKITLKTGQQTEYAVRVNLFGYGADIYRSLKEAVHISIEENEIFCQELFNAMMKNFNPTIKKSSSFEVTVLSFHTLCVEFLDADGVSHQNLMATPRGNVRLESEMHELLLQCYGSYELCFKEIATKFISRIYHDVIISTLEDNLKNIARNAGDASVYMENMRNKGDGETTFDIISHIKGFSSVDKKVLKVTVNKTKFSCYDGVTNQCLLDGMYNFQSVETILLLGLSELRQTLLKKIFENEKWTLTYEGKMFLHGMGDIITWFTYGFVSTTDQVIVFKVKNCIRCMILMAYSFSSSTFESEKHSEKFWNNFPHDFTTFETSKDNNVFQEIRTLTELIPTAGNLLSSNAKIPKSGPESTD